MAAALRLPQPHSMHVAWVRSPGGPEAARGRTNEMSERAGGPQVASACVGVRTNARKISKETFMRLRHSYPMKMATGNHLQ